MATVTGTKRKLAVNVEALEANNTLTLGSNAVATQAWVTSTIIDGAPDALNTLNELAAAINDTSNYASTVTTALGNRLRLDAAQPLTDAQRAQGRTNLGLGTAAVENTGAFATADHTHDTAYAALNHTHDYASSSHNHDDRYWRLTRNVSVTGSNPFDDAHTATRVTGTGNYYISYTGASAQLISSATGGSASIFQIGAHYNGSDFYMRTRTDSATWQTWKKLWHNGNFDPSAYALASHTHDYASSSHNHDGRYMRMDSDTHTTGGIEIRGSLSRGTYTTASQYHTGADNIVLKGNASGISGIFFESEKDGTNINHASDFGFIQYHAYGTGTSGESNELVIGVSNDADDHVILNAPNVNGLKFRTGASDTDYTIWHAGNFDAGGHTHDGRYYTETEVNNLLNGKANSSHNHDDRYYTESESDSRYAGRGFQNEAYVDVYVRGDADTFYPVRIAGGATFGYHRYSISRGYSWTAPDTWYTATHRGGLTFTVEWSGDVAWGGNHKPIRVVEFGESYSNMVGGLALPVTGGLMVWLRGGNAHYRFHCPTGVEHSITVDLEGFTAANGTVYSPRTLVEAGEGRTNEVYPRWPVRGDNDLYDSNQRVATQTWVGDNYQAAGSYAASNHNHTYNVNDSWLRENGDNANFKIYGNSRQIAFRTDGTSEYASGVGGYPFVWMYGGDASSNRRMILNSSGQLWLSNYGWLHDKFADATHNHDDVYQPAGSYALLDHAHLEYLGVNAKAADSNLLDGLDLHTGRNNEANKVVRTDANGYIQAGWINTTSGATTSTLSRIYASNDGYIRYVTPDEFRKQITDGIYQPAGSYAASSHNHNGVYQPAGSYAGVNGSYNNDFYGNAFYYDDWVRNHTNTNGIYWSTTGWHLYPIDNDDFRVRSGNSSSAALRFNTGGTDRNYVYNNNSNEIGFLSTSRGWIFKVTNSGTATATGDVVAFSDRRLKENIETIPNALEKVEALRGVTFTRKDTGKESIGLIAQEVEEVIPEVVNNEGEYKGVAYGNLVGVLIEAVKELSAEVEELKAKLGE